MGGMMEKQRKVSNPLALAVLAFLSAAPMHPYELGKRLRETDKDRSIRYNHGSLYMVIKQLAKVGFVAEQDTVREGGRPERTVYAITTQGRDEMRNWLRELVAEPRREYPHFGVALSLISVLPPDEAAGLLDRRLRALASEIEEIRSAVEAAAGAGVSWVFLADDEYHLAILQAEHQFVSRLVDSLRQPDHVREWHEFFEGRT
ncbi:PadR family transcriptional regulator [Microbispora sitophila]|uniref:PadR family transcriptional regulator n=1 Tax=Microbispora sitophila TaxID=2771537 RepID=UPI001D027CEB|nr:PadR family transcriptional regulator [Microbispora sitophila]